MASSRGGWLEGTMDVISGKVLRSSSAHGPPLGRSSSPFLQRVPSEDVMQRSAHNDSGHGKSTAQIIKDLKASNAKLTAQAAEMEADFMNQVNLVTLKYSDEQRALQDTLAKKEQLILEMESRGGSVETRIREKDSTLSKLKEETAFQRHTIADLKNQLYQLQNDIEEAEYDKNDEVDKWKIEKQEMLREMETLKKQFQESRDENESLRSQLASKDETGEGGNVLQSWKKLEETKKELAQNELWLKEAKSSLATTENESKRLQKEQEAEMALLRAKLVEIQLTLSSKEQEWRDQLALAQNHSEFQSKIEEQENTISGLREELTCQASQIDKLTIEKAKWQAESESRDLYRHDEASDLRVLNDAQADEIQQLKEDCQEMEREIAERDEALSDSMAEAENAHKQVEELSRALVAMQESSGDETERRYLELETALQESNESCRALDEELKGLTRKHDLEVSDLHQEIETILSQRDDAESRLALVIEQRDESVGNKDRSLHEDHSRLSKRLRDVVASAAKERADLEKEHDELLAAFERTKQEEIHSLQETLDARNEEIKSLEEVRRAHEISVSELNDLKAKLSMAERMARSTTVKPEDSRTNRKNLEKEKDEVARLLHELRESQIALVQLDDDKERLQNQLKETRAQWEEQRNKLIDDYEAQLMAKEEEIAKSDPRSGDLHHLTELVMECSQLEERIKRKDEEIAKLKSKRSINGAMSGKGGALEEALRQELVAAKDAEEKLANALDRANSEKQAFEAKIKAKLEDRDTTISTLVKSSVMQEQKLAKMKMEIDTLKSQPVATIGKKDLPSSRDRSKLHTSQDEDVENLRSALDDCKAIEKRLHNQVADLEKKLFSTENELDRLRTQLNEGDGIGNDNRQRYDVKNDLHEKLQERDSAIANLVKQAMTQEAFVKKLTAENTMLRRKSPGKKQLESSDERTRDEMKQLQKESEIFASQIIEQDEEMQALRLDLEDRDREVGDLRRDLHALRKELDAADKKSTSRTRDMDRIADLQAELDEMKEANETQRQEVRELRRQLRESQSAFDTVDDLRLELELAHKTMDEIRGKAGTTALYEASLRDELNLAIASKEATEKRLAQQIESMHRLRDTAVEELQAKLRARDEAINELKATCSKADIDRLNAEVERLKTDNEHKTSIVEDAKVSLEELRSMLDEKLKPDEEKAALLVEKETLMMEIAELKSKLETLEEDMAGIANLKCRLHEAEEGRDNAERSIMDSYERKISLLKLNKDVAIDNLRKELLEAKTQKSEVEADMMSHIKSLEMENKDLKDELDAKLQLKNSKIVALEQTLGAQEQLIENMRQEMDHLQGSMERSTIGRRAEIEEMQQELIDTTGKAQRLEREITSLKMKIEQRELEHESQISKMEERLTAMHESPLASTLTKETSDRIADLKEKFENLKWRNTSLQEENKSLRLKLERAQDGSTTKRSMALEVENLEKRVEELEGEKSEWTASTTPTSRVQSSTQSTQPSSKPPTPPSESSSARARSVKRNGSTSRGTKAASPSPIRTAGQSPVGSPSKSTKAPAGSPGRFFLKRRPQKDSGGAEAPKDDASAASKKDDASAASKLTF